MTRNELNTAKSFCASPHIFLFVCYNLLYFVPLLLISLWGYSGGGIGEEGNINANTIIGVSIIYSLGVAAFICGSMATRFISWSIYGTSAKVPKWSWFQVKLSDGLLIAVILIIFLLSKLALIPLGVYHQYELEMMSGGAWSFSTFCAESLILCQIMVLFSKSKYNLTFFFFLAAANGINLLHGTRIFLIISCAAMVLYVHVRGHLTLKRLILIGPAACLVLLCAGYAVFLVRSSVVDENRFTIIRLFSPIVFESLFSQLSLMTVIGHPDSWSPAGHFIEMVKDVLINAAPRLVIPDKDEIKFIDQFASFSPLGAFNGYAQGLLYLGIFFPAFYFALGVIANWLYIRAQQSGWWFILYSYFTADVLFRIMRDGYLLPFKILINGCQILLIFIVWRSVLRVLSSSPSTYMEFHG